MASAETVIADAVYVRDELGFIITPAKDSTLTAFKDAFDARDLAKESTLGAFKTAFDLRDLAKDTTLTDGSQRTGALGEDGTSIASSTNPLPTGFHDQFGNRLEARLLNAFTTTAGSVPVEQNQDDVKLDWSNDDPNVFLTDTSNGGTASRVTGEGQVEFATGAGEVSPGVPKTVVFETKTTVFYNAAHDDECEFTTEWVDVGGVGDSLVKGLFTATNGFGLGYKDGKFAFMHRKAGVDHFHYAENGLTDYWLDTFDGSTPTPGYTKNGVDQVIDLSKNQRWKLQGALLGAETWDLHIRTPDKQWLLVHRHYWSNEETGSILDNFDLKMRVEGTNAGTGANLRVRTGSWRAGVYTSESPDFTKLLNREILDTEELRTDVEPTSSEYYLGKAADSTPTSEAAWDVLQITLSATRNPTRFRFRKNVAWDDRATGWT